MVEGGLTTVLAGNQLGVFGKALFGRDPSLATPEGWFDIFAILSEKRGIQERYTKASLEQSDKT